MTPTLTAGSVGQQALLERSLRRGYAPLGRRDTPAAGELVNLGLGSIVAVNVSGYIEHRFVPNQTARQRADDQPLLP